MASVCHSLIGKSGKGLSRQGDNLSLRTKILLEVRLLAMYDVVICFTLSCREHRLDLTLKLSILVQWGAPRITHGLILDHLQSGKLRF